MDEAFIYVVTDGNTKMARARFGTHRYIMDIHDGERLGFLREVVFRTTDERFAGVFDLCDAYANGEMGREDLETRVLELNPAN